MKEEDDELSTWQSRSQMNKERRMKVGLSLLGKKEAVAGG